MTHASRELLDAIRGQEPGAASYSEEEIESGCEDDELGDMVVLASDGFAARRSTSEDRDQVECSRCLARMAEARGEARTEALLVHLDQLLYHPDEATRERARRQLREVIGDEEGQRNHA